MSGNIATLGTQFATIIVIMRPLLLLTAVLALVLSIDAQTKQPVMLKTAEPTFAPEALSQVYGKFSVQLFLEIDKTGHVKDVDAFGPWHRCTEDDRENAIKKAAIQAAKQFLFIPADQDGKAVEGTFLTSLGGLGTMAPKPAPATKTGAVVFGKRISIPAPKYPSKAKKYHLQGETVVFAETDEQGNVYNVLAGSGHPILLQAAAEAACGAKFTPTTHGGQPAKVSFPINFNITP